MWEKTEPNEKLETRGRQAEFIIITECIEKKD